VYSGRSGSAQGRVSRLHSAAGKELSMSEHRALIAWTRTTDSFGYKDYKREHTWTFKNGAVVQASAAPRYLGSADCIDPEEAFVASVSSCHMLTFLALCARRGIVVDRYTDDAVGTLAPNQNKKLAVTRVVLRPRIEFAPGHTPDEATLKQIHEESHHECFIANSVLTTITVEAPSDAAP